MDSWKLAIPASLTGIIFGFWLGWGVVGTSIHAVDHEAAAALGTCRQEAAEAAPDVIYGLFWLDYDCSFFFKKFPTALHPFLCDARVSAYRAASLPKVLARLEDLSPWVPATLYAERGVREKAVKFHWVPKRGK